MRPRTIRPALAPPQEVEVKVRHLRVADRCDSCRARAYVRVSVGDLPLDFCAHHYRKHAEALAEQGASVLYDERDVLEAETAASRP